MKKSMIFLVLLAVAFPIGCAGRGLQNVNDEHNIGSQQNRATIIGKASLEYENYIGIPTYRVIYISRIQEMKDQKWMPFNVNDEYFIISLEAGEYMITGSRLGIGFIAAFGKTYLAKLNYRFRAEPGEIIYIGNLTVQYRAHQGDGSEPAGTFLFDTSSFITDDFENASKEFYKQYPNVKEQIKKSLMN